MAKGHIPSVHDRLLNAGVTVFRKSGFNGCSVQDITEAAGVPKGSFYNHFASKEALGVAALEHYWNENDKTRLQTLDRDDLTPLLRLRTYFDQFTADLAGMDFTCGCFIGNMTAELSDHSAAVSAQLSTIFVNWTCRVAACIAQAQQAGEVSSKADSQLLATFALNAWQGAVLRARVEKSIDPLKQFSDVLFTQILR